MSRQSVAFVTGGSSGLGAAICKKLGEEAIDVAVGYRKGEDRAREICKIIESFGSNAKAFRIDLEDANSIETAVNAVVQHFSRLDILINNAAMAMGIHNVAPGDLDAFTPEIWDEMMTINLRGPFLVSRAAASHLRASKKGRIINIGSTLGAGEWYADRAFAPSKASVVPLTKFLAATLAPDVAVNCVAPGLMVETGLGSGGPKHLVDRWKNRSTLNITTSVSDVSDQVIYLCKASSITGQTIVIDGGIHFH